MTRETMKLRKVAEPDIWLVTWTLADPVWAVVRGRRTPSAMLAEVVQHVGEIPWRSDTPSRIEVGKAVQEVER